MTMRLPGGVTLLTVLAAAAGGALAQPPAAPGPKPDWTTEKCVRYRKAYDDSLSRLGRQGLGAEFLARHDAFLASNCTAQADVCARSKEELELANMLVILAMNAGMASTFLPFYCRS